MPICERRCATCMRVYFKNKTCFSQYFYGQLMWAKRVRSYDKNTTQSLYSARSVFVLLYSATFYFIRIMSQTILQIIEKFYEETQTDKHNKAIYK